MGIRPQQHPGHVLPSGPQGQLQGRFPVHHGVQVRPAAGDAGQVGDFPPLHKIVGGRRPVQRQLFLAMLPRRGGVVEIAVVPPELRTPKVAARAAKALAAPDAAVPHLLLVVPHLAGIIQGGAADIHLKLPPLRHGEDRMPRPTVVVVAAGGHRAAMLGVAQDGLHADAENRPRPGVPQLRRAVAVRLHRDAVRAPQGARHQVGLQGFHPRHRVERRPVVAVRVVGVAAPLAEFHMHIRVEGPVVQEAELGVGGAGGRGQRQGHRPGGQQRGDAGGKAHDEFL